MDMRQQGNWDQWESRHSLLHLLEIPCNLTKTFSEAAGDDFQTKLDMVLRIVLATEGFERFSRLQAPLYYTHGFVMKKGIAYYSVNTEVAALLTFLNIGIGVKQKFTKIVPSVKDFATGIPSQDQSKRFEPYSLAWGWDRQQDHERAFSFLT